MNPNLAAVIVAIVLGFAIIPWNIALKQVSGGQLFVAIGIVYVIGGMLQAKFWTGTRSLTGTSIAWAFGTAIIYFISITGCNYIFGHPTARLPIVTAITAGYPIVTAIFAAALKKQMLTLAEIFFLTLAVGGIVGLSLTGKHA